MRELLPLRGNNSLKSRADPRKRGYKRTLRIRTVARMILVRVAMMVAAAAVGVAALLASTAEELPETLEPVPAVCVTVPIASEGQLQAGYCP